MKKIFLFSFLLFGLVISAQQTFVLNPAMVDPDDAENFENHKALKIIAISKPQAYHLL